MIYFKLICYFKDKGITIGDRPQLQANLEYADYLDILKGRKETMHRRFTKDSEGKNPYRHEVGGIPELEAAWAFSILREKQQVLHDYGTGEDSAAILCGIVTKNKSVPVSYFDEYDDGVFLLGWASNFQDNNGAGASSVKVC